MIFYGKKFTNNYSYWSDVFSTFYGTCFVFYLSMWLCVFRFIYLFIQCLVLVLSIAVNNNFHYRWLMLVWNKTGSHSFEHNIAQRCLKPSFWISHSTFIALQYGVIGWQRWRHVRITVLINHLEAFYHNTKKTVVQLAAKQCKRCFRVSYMAHCRNRYFVIL